jgi:orotate phosphoribosyltransferase
LKNLPEDGRVALIEDVVTTGGTLLQVIDRVEAAGFRVGLVVTVVDRQEGGAEILAGKGYPLKALFTRESLLSC